MPGTTWRSDRSSFTTKQPLGTRTVNSNNMRNVLVLLVLLVGFAARAQSPFLQLYYSPDTLYLHDDGMLVMEAANGDVAHLCHLGEAGNDTDMVVFRRLDPDGLLLAHTRIITTSSFTGLTLYSGEELPDGSFLFFGSESPYMVVLHVDAQGNLISVRRRNSYNGYYKASLWENDSTILAVGYDFISPGPRRLLLSRFDAEGEYLNSHGYLIDGHGATGVMAIRCAAGGVLIAADGADTVGTANAATARSCLLRLDEQGNVLWARRYVRPGQLFYPKGLLENADGTILMAGTMLTIGGAVHTYTLHVDALGDTLATREIRLMSPPLPNAGINPWGLATSSDSTAVITGFLSGDGFVISCDRTGAPQASSQFPATHLVGPPLRSSQGDLLFGVKGWPPAGFQAGGATGVWRSADPFALACSAPFGIQGSSPQLLLGQGYSQQPVDLVFEDITPLCTQVQDVMTAFDPCLSTQASTSAAAAAIQVWPTSATDHIMVSAPDMERIEIMDACGRVVRSLSTKAVPTLQVDISALAPGPYLVHVTTRSGVHVKRMVKE